MIALLVFIPLLAFILVLLGAPARATSLLAAVTNLGLAIYAALSSTCSQAWTFKYKVLDFPDLELSFAFQDGMSLVMALLAVIVTVAALLSGQAPEGKHKLYYGSTLLISAGAIGAFISTNIFFFYAFHELALIPTFILIGLMGRNNRREVAWKVTLYLGFASIVLLAGLVWLVALTGSMDIATMIQHSGEIAPAAQKGIAALLIVGFGALVSLFPFHSWAAPAYANAPAPLAMMHAGVLKKFGLYGLLRIAVPMVPQGMQDWLNVLLILLLGNILWVGWVTLSQRRLDLMLGNSSVMHMGYIFLAIAALVADASHPFARNAAIFLMFAHGISIAVSFSLADRIERKTGSLDFDDLGGLARSAPSLAFCFGMAMMASIGLPGLGNFVGEVMVFFSAFKSYNPSAGLAPLQWACILAIWGVVISAVYGLRSFRRMFHGEPVPATAKAADLTWMEKLPVALLLFVLLSIGVFPGVLLQFLN